MMVVTPEALLQRPDLLAQVQPHDGIERRERFVEQQQPRFDVASARASATRCCCPPDSCAGYFGACSARPTRSSSSATRWRMRALRPGGAAQAVADVLGHRQVGEQRVGLEDDAEVALGGRQRGDVAPAPGRSARVDGGSSPAMARSSVVLPQPDGPRKETNSPLATVQADAFQGDEGAELLADVAHREEGLAGSDRPPLPRGKIEVQGGAHRLSAAPTCRRSGAAIRRSSRSRAPAICVKSAFTRRWAKSAG